MKKADADPFGRERLSNEAVILPRHDLQQAALPGAVQSENANLRARQERQPDIFQNDMVGLVHLPQALHGVDELRHSRKLSALSFQRWKNILITTLEEDLKALAES
jgi:hypothetical protein